MQVQSTKRPKPFNHIQGKIHFNYNIEEKTVKNEEGISETLFIYKTVVFNKIDRNEIIAKMIRSKYTIDEEFALINNKNLGTHFDEYNEYQNYRSTAKEKVDAALSELKTDVTYFQFLKGITHFMSL